MKKVEAVEAEKFTKSTAAAYLLSISQTSELSSALTGCPKLSVHHLTAKSWRFRSEQQRKLTVQD